jgi:hypothetical protein
VRNTSSLTDSHRRGQLIGLSAGPLLRAWERTMPGSTAVAVHRQGALAHVSVGPGDRTNALGTNRSGAPHWELAVSWPVPATFG